SIAKARIIPLKRVKSGKPNAIALGFPLFICNRARHAWFPATAFRSAQSGPRLLLWVQVLLYAGIVQIGLGEDRLARTVVLLEVVVAVEVLDLQAHLEFLHLVRVLRDQPALSIFPFSSDRVDGLLS